MLLVGSLVHVCASMDVARVITSIGGKPHGLNSAYVLVYCVQQMLRVNQEHFGNVGQSEKSPLVC